jgi:transcriptional regulator with XRE-family HTH domain
VGKQRVTIRDIAQRLGVSPATVSTALTGRRNGVFVSEETKRRVWEVAQELGYPLERLRARGPQLQRVAPLAPTPCSSAAPCWNFPTCSVNRVSASLFT